MSSSNNPNPIKSMRAEVLEVAAGLAEMQTRLNQILDRLDDKEEDPSIWKTRCENLEVSYKEAVTSAKWLRSQNAELEKKVSKYQPEMNNALDARDAAFKRLKHARKVIRDLLEERGDMSPRRGLGLITQEEIEQALYDDFRREDKSSSSSSSDRTVGPTGQSSSDSGFNTPKTFLSASGSLSPALSTGGSVVIGAKSPIATTPSSSNSSNLIRLSPHAHVSSSTKNSPDFMAIHFKKPPGSASICEGPISWDKLQRSLHLQDDAMNSLHSLGESIAVTMRVEIMRFPSTNQTAAFLHDPIFIENRDQKKSFLLCWGLPDMNEDIEKYILQNKAEDSIFHTFTFPLKENAWYYIGALSWSIVELADIWPLEGKSRTKMVKKLCERTRGAISEDEMGKLLDAGKMKQFCVELIRAPDPKMSVEFAQAILHQES